MLLIFFITEIFKVAKFKGINPAAWILAIGLQLLYLFALLKYLRVIIFLNVIVCVSEMQRKCQCHLLSRQKMHRAAAIRSCLFLQFFYVQFYGTLLHICFFYNQLLYFQNTNYCLKGC